MNPFQKFFPALAAFILFISVLACAAQPAVTVPATLPISPVEGTWLKIAGDTKSDQSWTIVTDDQGNFYWGTFQQAPGDLFTDWVIYKFDAQGSQIWEKRWGENFQEKLFIMAVSPPYLLLGGEQDHSINISQADMIVLALNLETGEVAWQFTYDQGFGYEEVDGLVADGDYIYISGWTTSQNTGNDVGLVKIDRQGNLVWAQAWGGPKFDEADGQMVVDDEYIYVTGRYGGENILFGGLGLMAKFRKDTGEYVSHVLMNDSQFYDGYGMTSDGSYLYVTGLTLVSRGLSTDGQVFIQKWDKDLNPVWEQQWGGSGGDQSRAIAVDETGRIIVAANATLQGDKQIALLEYDDQGSLLLEKTWGGSGEDVVHGLWLDGPWAYLAGQTTSTGEGMSDALLLRVDIAGGTFPPVP